MRIGYTAAMKMFENIGDALPWYVAGLAFECTECGRCCAGPAEGFVWATDEELQAIARHLGMSEQAFRKKYVRRVGRRQSLVEEPKSKDCIFLDGKRCRIYAVRPTQCRTWPFWSSNIASPADWSFAAQRCPGINRGPLHSLEDIQRKAGITQE